MPFDEISDPAAQVIPQKHNKLAEEKLYCAACGHLITLGKWRTSVKDGHEHTVFNPAGVIFEIGCFKEAPGSKSIGQPSAQFTWFKGFKWQISLCGNCGVHLGWLFTGPSAFYGLILKMLTSKRSVD